MELFVAGCYTEIIKTSPHANHYHGALHHWYFSTVVTVYLTHELQLIWCTLKRNIEELIRSEKCVLF